tara:strand:+ start:284 stop:499 length:216 start_codon:yes stop_codon:yes gene_type:complete
MTSRVEKSARGEIVKFKWPDYVLFEGREIKCSNKFPHYAEYMLPRAYMDKKIVVNKSQWFRHLDKYDPLDD